jgi:hypothetical protein
LLYSPQDPMLKTCTAMCSGLKVSWGCLADRPESMH